jgi:replication factor C subunit 3/5
MIILDEADAMTQVAQNALRRGNVLNIDEKVIEKYTKNVRFCMICNYVGKIIPALQSRCTKFRFAPLQETHIQSRLEYIVEKEQVKITQDGKQALYRLCQGDMRRVLNILQATHAAHDIVNEAAIYECAGAPLPSDIKRILDWLMKLDFTNAYSSNFKKMLMTIDIYQLKQEKGLALVDILREVHDLLAVMEIPKSMRLYLLEQMAEIEYRLASATSEKIQLGSLIAAFRTALEFE